MIFLLLLEQTYKRALPKYYGQKPGRNLPLSDYGEFRSQVSMQLALDQADRFLSKLT